MNIPHFYPIKFFHSLNNKDNNLYYQSNNYFVEYEFLIKKYGTDTGCTEYREYFVENGCGMTDLFELPGIALLVVSDNSASGAALVGRTEEEQQQYDYGRNVVLPDMIVTLAAE